ncbi:MAG: helix-turn-helix domain-containing protein [Bacteroidales bacterium]|nr:helix-turn-helix domain-containing protein [Bacteroidales bacterium]
MNILCIPESRRCENYESDNKSMIEIVRDTKSFEKNSTHTLIVYILSGEISISYDTVSDYLLSKGDFMLFPPGARIYGKLKSPVKTLLLRINDHISLCDNYTLENLFNDYDITNIKHTHLVSNNIIKAYVTGLVRNIANGLRCVRFMEIKSQELFHYLRAYYPKDQLVGFSLPLLNTDSMFMDLVWKNYRQAHNMKELAQMINCSITKLDTKLKQITGLTAFRWLMEQKAKNIHHDLYYGQKTLKEISFEYHFSSVSHLGTFCRQYLGATPRDLMAINEQKHKNKQ